MGLLFGGKTGNRGKGRPVGSKNRVTAAQKLEIERRRREEERSQHLADLRALVEEERLNQELASLRTRRTTRAPRAQAKSTAELVASVLQPLAVALAPTLAGMVNTQRATLPPATTVRPVAKAAPVAEPESAPEALPASAESPSEATPEPAPAPPSGPLSLEDRWLIGEVSGKNPEELASLFLGLRLPIAQQICGHLATAKDEDLPVLWLRVKQASPNIGGFVDWFQQQPTYMPTIVAIRARLAANAASANGGIVH